MKKHEQTVKSLVKNVSNKVNNTTDWKTTITGNNQLLDLIEELKNEVCKAYVENIET